MRSDVIQTLLYGEHEPQKKASTMNARSVKKDQNFIDLKQFSARLQDAGTSLGLSIRQVAALVEKGGAITNRTAYAHLRGDRVPAYGSVHEYADAYASALGVERDWLLYGKTTSVINHVARSPNGDTSQLTPFRRIPLGVTSQHGDAGLRAMTHVPFPSELSNADDAFIWRIPEGDYSMVGDERKLSPGTFLVVEPVNTDEICPGHVILCRPKGFADFIVRMVKAIGPLGVAKRFELISANPLFDPIKVSSIGNCEMGGRAVFYINQL